ncbi:hypothetical protein PINS_up002269 [Pythium insidiosum]|nr:hypothetical protein PINS_up002269 [Pythium insidiosum]
MDAAVALLRTTQIKKRLAGVTQLLELLRANRDALTQDAAFLATLLPDVLPCLRDNNFKVAATALEILDIVLSRVNAFDPSGATVRNYFKAIWNSLIERLGDSKLQVREKAVDVVVRLVEAIGVAAVFDRLRPCIGHKNWRTREQTIHALWRCIESQKMVSTMKHDVLDDAVTLLEDSAKEVRDAAMQTLEKFFQHLGPALMYDLESKNIRSSHMKTLTERFGGSRFVAPKIPDAPLSSNQAEDVPMTSTERFLSALRNRQYHFDDSTGSNVSADRSPSQVSNASTRSFPSATDTSVISGPGSIGSSIGERDVQRDMTKIGDGLKLENDWSVRVESLKSLQRLAHKCNGSPNAVAALSVGFRGVREIVCEQVSDLRSSVAREACQTLQTLAKVIRDDFNSHAEYCMGNLLKATYVTIQVISTAADSSIRGIIESTSNGYNRVINKFVDGAKTRNQVLRHHCTMYLTLTLERWSAAFLSRTIDVIIQVLPALLHDAVSDVRAQARKCYWALHSLFPQDAVELYERLDSSTQRNIREDQAKRNGIDGAPPALATMGRSSIRKEAARSASESISPPFGTNSFSDP